MKEISFRHLLKKEISGVSLMGIEINLVVRNRLEVIISELKN
jgi:hypothetical protein